MSMKEESSASVHGGHRRRMRERYRREGLESFAPHELLELLLFFTRPRGDVNPLAHELLSRFGSLHGVFEAKYEHLMKVKGVGEETATLISMMLPMFRRYAASINEDRGVIRNRTDALKYCIALQAGRRNESLFLIVINGNCRVTGHYLIAEGTICEVQAYPRIIVETALNCNAEGVILCHNHPGGHAFPSQADIEATQLLEKLLAELDITLLDHIIVSGEMTYSMAGHGDIRISDDAAENTDGSAVEDERVAELLRNLINTER